MNGTQNVIPAPTKEEAEIFTAAMKKIFKTGNDAGRIIICPIIMAELTWQYALYTVMEAADKRIGKLVKPSRITRHGYEGFKSDMQKKIGIKEYEQIRDCAAIFADENEDHLQLLFYPANQALKNTGQQLPYENMQTFALSSICLAHMCQMNRTAILSEVKAQMGDIPLSYAFDFTPQSTSSLAKIMELYVGRQTLNLVNKNDINLQRAIDVLLIQFKKFNIEIDLNKILYNEIQN